MTINELPRTVANRLHGRRLIQRLAVSPGAAATPSETAITSIAEKRATPRW